MAVFQFRNAGGQPMDAHYEFSHERHLLMHSRGGTIGAKNARNTEYGQALRILLERTRQSNLELQKVWVDSQRVQKLPLSARRIYTEEDAHLAPGKLYSRLSRRMAQVGRDSENQRHGGNPTKRLRFSFAGSPSEAKMIRRLGWGWLRENENIDNIIPAKEFERVTPEWVCRAVEDLLSKEVSHGFGRSTSYDVICPGGARLSPKAVFGLAASKAFGFNLLPEHFRGGINTPCFRAITEAGYEISLKDANHLTTHLPINTDDREWVEGNKRRVTHLVRERASGLAAKKKAEFARQHGRLFCERCELDPIAIYGAGIGEACIEVHHRIPLQEILEGQRTKLDDLVCLCANCHRMVHYELRHST